MITYWQQENGRLVKKDEEEIDSGRNTWVDARCVTRDDIKELEEKEITAAAGGGAVEVTVSGKHEITKVKLSEEVVDPDDIEMLEDLIMAATNEALRQIDEASQKSMSQITGGLGGGFPF